MLSFPKKNKLFTLENISIFGGIFLVILSRILWMNRHYYISGGYIMDTAWYAHLISNVSYKLTNPSVISNGNPVSYYNTHISPGFFLYSLLSPFKNLSYPNQLGIFLGLFQSLTFPLLYFSIKRSFKNVNKLSVYTFSFIFTICSVPERLVSYPHPEIIIPILICFSLYFFTKREIKLSIITGLISCLFREDAGLHLALVYFVLIFYFYFFEKLRPEYKDKISFYKKYSIISFITGLSVALSSILVQKTFFNADSALTRIYLGEPPFSHITFNSLIERLGNFSSSYLWFIIPFLIYYLISIFSRNILFIIGFISCVPWFTLNFLALGGVASKFELYYGFPFLIAILFPFITVNSEIDFKGIGYKKNILSVHFLLISSFYLFSSFSQIKGYMPVDKLVIEATNSSIEKIQNNLPILKKEKIVFSTPIVAFNPDNYTRENMADWVIARVNANNSEFQINGFVYMDNAFESNMVNDFVAKNFDEDSTDCFLNENSKVRAVFMSKDLDSYSNLCKIKY